MTVSLDRFGPAYTALRVLFMMCLIASLVTLGLGSYSIHRGVAELGMVLLGSSAVSCGAMFILNAAVRRMCLSHLAVAARAISAHYGVPVSIAALCQYLDERQEAPRRHREDIVPLRASGASQGSEEPLWGLRYASESRTVTLHRLTASNPVLTGPPPVTSS